MLVEMTIESLPAIQQVRLEVYLRQGLGRGAGIFGALPYLYGSVVSSVLALLLATPLSIGAAVLITEICPETLGGDHRAAGRTAGGHPHRHLRPLGRAGHGALAAVDRRAVSERTLRLSPLLPGAPYGVSMLAAVFILMIMVVPIITSITKEVLLAVPQSQKEAAIALGATRWEMILMAVLPYGRSGILGAAILGLGRAVGETMAVTMVIGNTPQISLSLLSPA